MRVYLCDCEENVKKMLTEAIELQPYFDVDHGVALEIQKQQENGYQITFESEKCRIAYHTFPQLCRALLYVIAAEKKTDVTECCAFDEFGMMFDVSRNAVLRMKTIKTLIRMAAYLGYGFVGLYMEDTIQVEEEPYFGYMRGALTCEELKEADAYAEIFGIELRPFIQTLAHLNQIVRYEEYQKIIDTDDILLAEDPRTKTLLEHLIRTVSKNFSSKKINIGMDEAHMVGLGKYLDQHGYRNRQEIMQRHLEMVLSICKQYGFTVQMWSDMFFRLAFHGAYYENDVEKLRGIHIPQEVEIGYWDYYSTDEAHYDEMIRRHKQLTERTAFVGGAWKWTGFIPHNRYSIQAGKAALAACKKNRVDSVTITCWGDDGAEASAFSVLPTFFADAQIAYGSRMSENAFRLLTGYQLQEFLRLDDVNPYIEDGSTHNNASKYMLYNDPLIGTFDSVIRKDTAEKFGKTAEFLGELPKESPFFYLMETARNLCLVLEKKADLGKKIRLAYSQEDKDALYEIANTQIPVLLQRLQNFYQSFRTQWNLENKSFGFEVQTVRIGGLLQRLKDVQEILNAYLREEISVIAELNEPQKAFHYFEQNEIRSLNYNLWTDIVSPSKI